jgi:putative peptidoglycan lipid II flippase
MAFLRSFGLLSLLTVVCRFTGYLREWLMAEYMGVSATTDALCIAFRLPSFFRRLFAEGAFHVSFLPAFTKSGNDRTFAGMVLSLLILVLGGLILIIEWQFQSFSGLLFRGLQNKPETLALVLRFGPITFPYIFFISVVSFFGSILNAYGRFSLLTLSHAMGNVFILAYVWLGARFTNDYGGLFAWGVLLSGAVQLVYILVPCWRMGYAIRPRWPRMTVDVLGFLRTFIPGLLGTGAVQLNSIVSMIMAMSLASGSMTYLSYADRLYHLPLSILGIPLSSILLPMLASQVRAQDSAGANTTQDRVAGLLSLLILPCVGFLITMAVPCVAFFFGAGRLTGTDLLHISSTLQAFSLGIPALIMIKVLSTRFFAEGQMMVPLVGNLGAMALDVALIQMLIGPLEHVGIALASSLAAWANFTYLCIMLWRKYGWKLSKDSLIMWAKSLVAISGAIAVWTTHSRAIPNFVQLPFFFKMAVLGGYLAAGLGIFVVIAWALKIICEPQRAFLRTHGHFFKD